MRGARAIGALWALCAAGVAGVAGVAGAAAADEQAGPLPSGAEPPALYEVVTAEGYQAPVWHFRFLWQGLTPEMLAGEAMSADLLALCSRIAAPRIALEGGRAERIVIAISDRKTAFGAPAPEAVQSFEGFVLGADGACEWEPF